MRKSSVRKQTKSYVKAKNRHSNSDSQWHPSPAAACSPGSVPQAEQPPYSGPQVRPFVKPVVRDGAFCAS